MKKLIQALSRLVAGFKKPKEKKFKVGPSSPCCNNYQPHSLWKTGAFLAVIKKDGVASFEELKD
jgi:hypothetical protein